MASYYKAMSSKNDEVGISGYHDWDEDRLGLFFRQRGLGAYCEVMKQHKITGRLAPHMSDDNLKEMGISCVGDRLMFRHVLKDLSRQERFKKRIESLWEGQERMFFSNYERNCWTLCGLFPIDPSTYKLSRNHIKVKKVQPVRCGPVRLCCFGSSHVSNNIDLSKVDDVDVMGIPAPCFQRTCCCASGKDIVEVESRFEKDGKITLVLAEGHGEVLANLILNQVEESQKMERS